MEAFVKLSSEEKRLAHTPGLSRQPYCNMEGVSLGGRSRREESPRAVPADEVRFPETSAQHDSINRLNVIR